MGEASGVLRLDETSPGMVPVDGCHPLDGSGRAEGAKLIPSGGRVVGLGLDGHVQPDAFVARDDPQELRRGGTQRPLEQLGILAVAVVGEELIEPPRAPTEGLFVPRPDKAITPVEEQLEASDPVGRERGQALGMNPCCGAEGEGAGSRARGGIDRSRVHGSLGRSLG